jgi:virginiamycin B lyase
MTRASFQACLGGAAAALAFPILTAGAQTGLPPGHARDLVAQRCEVCHELGRVTGSGYDLAGWKGVVARMANMGAKVTSAESDQIAGYLAANYPDRRPPAAIIQGPVRVTFREWKVPTAGSRPHDPLATPDGMLWYTGQMANVLGRVDPKTGQIREFRLPHADSGPHGLAADAQGQIWFTANFAGYIGRLDPATGKVVEYKMPDPAARDPHTLIFDRKGIIWFTVQGGDMVGRLDPKTGAIRLERVSAPHANPYGMALDSQGGLFFDQFGTNRIGRIDPETMKIKDYVLPEPASRPRRIAITPDDMVWFTDFARGRLGRLDPATGKVEDWPSPGGPRSQPYAITALDGMVWYVESNTRPNALVRFDPRTQHFQTWAIPAGGGVVRNMMPTRDGGLALAESGLDTVAIAQIR